jgi:hypothetical protein
VRPADDVAYVVKACHERSRRGQDVGVSRHQMVVLIAQAW